MKTFRKMAYIRNWPIAIKLSVFYSILFTITATTVTFSSFVIYRSSMEQQTKEYIPQILNKMNITIENYVSALISVAQMSTFSPYNSEITDLIRTPESMNQFNSLENVMKMFVSLNFSNSVQSGILRAVTVYTNYGYAYTRLLDSGGMWELKPYENQVWYKENNPPTSLKVVGATKDPMGEGLVFSVVQPLRPLGFTESYGYFEVAGSLKPVQEMAHNIDFGPHAQIYIMDHTNTILYSTESKGPKAGSDWASRFGLDWTNVTDSQDSIKIKLDKRDYLLSYYKSDKTLWKTVAVIPMENLSQGVQRVRSMTVLWISLGIIAVCLISVIVSFTITNPLRFLTRQLEHMENNNFAISLTNIRMDEVGRLADGLRKMGKRISNLINEVYKSTLLKQEAEIHALQSQINPHFMNNVLETIRMMNKTGKHREVDEGLMLFGQLTRYYTKQSGEMVSIRSELEFIECYLQLQKLRFAECLEMRIDVQPKALPYNIPNLLIQPILENAITHGQSPYDQHIRIILKIYIEDLNIIISIVDEGPGMNPEKLDRLQSILEGEHTHKERIGLLNVHQRIQLIYNREGSMIIHSEEDLGTKIVIKIPIRKEIQNEIFDRR